MAVKKGMTGDILRLFRESLIIYREGMKTNDVMLALDGVRGGNALLPSKTLPGSQLREYGIIESTKEYEREQAAGEIIRCPNNAMCVAPIEFDQSQLGERDVTANELLYGGQYDKRSRIWYNRKMVTWKCPDCRTEHDMYDIDGNEILHTTKPDIVSPNFIRVVPHPPNQSDYDGVDGIRRWQFAMRPWLHNYFVELMQEITRYRHDMIKAGVMIPDDVQDDLESVQ